MATANTLYSNFVDAADVAGNIKNDKAILLYLSTLANTIVRIGDSKFKAVYPFIGGTAHSHKFNFINPQDTDAAFRLTFHGTVTHNSNGAVPDGSTGYADTYIIPSTHLSTSNGHLAFYTVTDTSGNMVEISSRLTSVTQIQLNIKGNGNLMSGGWCDWNNPIATVTTSKGLSMHNRLSISSQKLYKEGRILGTSDTASVSNTLSYPMKLFVGFGDSGFTNFSNRAGGFVSIGSGLTDKEAHYFTHQLRFIQGILGRQ